MSKTSENFVASVLRTDPVKSCCLLHQMFEEAGSKIFLIQQNSSQYFCKEFTKLGLGWGLWPIAAQFRISNQK